MTSPLAMQSLFSVRRLLICALAAVVVFTIVPAMVRAQHGGHVSGGHVSAPAPHMSAPPPPRPAASRPAPRPPAAVAPARTPSGAMVHPSPRTLTPPNAVAGAVIPGNPTENQASTGARSTIGFPRTTVFPAAGRPFAPRTGMTLNGDGHVLWVTNNARPALGGLQVERMIHGGPRRFRPQPILPVYYPIFYPVGFFGGYGLGYGFGFGACDPFWGWSFGCEGFGYSNYYGDRYGPMLSYNGPAEPDYLPVPSDGNTNGEQDEAVLYLRDGTVYLISDYWLADNKIHYITSDGAEHTIDLEQVDLQKSVDVNARRGVTFTLRPAPTANDRATPTTDVSPAAAAQDSAPPQQ